MKVLVLVVVVLKPPVGMQVSRTLHLLQVLDHSKGSV